MKKTCFTVLLTLCLGLVLCHPALAAEGLKDINGHWAQVQIEKWVTDGLIAGYPDGQFKPDDPITRAEFVSLVNRANKIEKSDSLSPFSDVKPTDWFFGQVMSGKEAGYIAGYPDGTFKPNHTISRQEAAVLITKLLRLSSEEPTALVSFTDYLSMDKWAQSSIDAVISHGIMSGFPDKTFKAQQDITRAEAVVTLDRLHFTGDTDLRQVPTNVPGKTSAVGGGGGGGGSGSGNGNGNGNGNGQPADTTPPSVSGACVNGSTLVLTFNENLDWKSVPLGDDFSVIVNGSEQAAPVNVAIAEAKVTITLAEAVKAGDTVTISYTPGASPIRDLAGNKAAALVGQPVENNMSELKAPALDRTVATNLFSSTAFLYAGENAVQTGMAADIIEENRAAVIRGQVLSRDGTPLPDVRITILNHPEFGSTISRTDGWFDMALNGGGVLTVCYEKAGCVTAQRQVNVPWQDFTLLPEVVLIPYDSNVTKIDLADASPMQTARGSQVTDLDGSRTATLIFPEGVQAEMEMPDGTKKTLRALNVRATEYSVGTNGPQAMPAILPPNVGYTYCVEYSADEAVAAGAKSVSFSQPVIHYVENFIGFSVGGIVPMGYYDYNLAAWIPSKNGRVIKIHAINDGMAELDIDGSGNPADMVALAFLGVTDSERQKLAALYPEGQELWRVPITHFTPWDCNWPCGPPADAHPPNLPLPRINQVDNPCTGSGSIIEYQNQVLGERAKVFGTPFTLNYRSSRVEGNKNYRSLQIPISAADVHKDLKRIILEVSVAGQFFTKTFPAEPNQMFLFTWDGKDAYGRTVQGSTPIDVRIGYVYPAVYYGPAQFEQAFGRYGQPGMWEGNRVRAEITAWQEWNDKILCWDSCPLGLGGWSLNVHHAYDPNSQTLYLGDGRSRAASGYVISTAAGNGIGSYNGDGGLATEVQINCPTGMAVGPDGSLYIADSWNSRIRQMDPDGIISTVAGNGTKGFSGDGNSATSAQINKDALGVAVGPDGSLYIADTYNSRIRRVGPDGIITTVAGIGPGYNGDGFSAAQAWLDYPSGIAVGPDGSLYIADTDNHRIRRVGPDGIISTVAGNGTKGYSGDGGPAAEAQLYRPFKVALGPDGSLYIADSINHRIRRVGPDGIITTVAGNGTEGYSGDGGRATQAQLNGPCDIVLGQDGSLYIVDAFNHCIRLVSPDGIITTVAGNGLEGFSGDGSSAAKAQLNSPSGIALGPDGSLYIADTANNRIRKVCQPNPGVLGSGLVFPSEDGTELYIFASGRHEKTINALTGSEIFRFTYDEQGWLAQVEDAFSNITRIERDEQGNPTAIIAPGGQRTYLEVNGKGYLSKIICPLFKEKNLTYTSEGLLSTFSDHKGNVHRFTYDELGRLVKDEDPAGGCTELSRSEQANGYVITVATAEGHLSTYAVEHLSTVSTRRVDTDALGGVTITEINSDGTRQVTYPDGTVATMVEGADPRPGMDMRAPITKEFTIITPGGLTSKVTRERTVEMDDVSDLFSVTKIIDMVNKNGKIYNHTYDIDAANQTVTVTTTTPEGRQTQSTLDRHGRPIQEINDSLQQISYTYDEKGHLTDVQQGDLSLAYTYDDMHRIIAIEDAAGDKFQYTYNDADVLKSITMPGGQTYRFGHDANGNTTEITMPSGAAHQVDYTVVDLPQGYTPPGNPGYQKNYNRDRALTQLTLPSGRSVSYSFDPSGRISGIAYDTVTSSFGYNDLTDRVASISRNPDGISYNYLYDGSLITNMATSLSDAAYDYNYRYDDDFSLLGFTLDGSPEITMGYDNDGLLTQYGPYIITHTGPSGLPSQISDGVMSITYTYDSYGRPVKRTNTVAGQQLYSLDIGYDNAGIISTRRETIAGAVNDINYTYDDNKQLTGVNGAVAESYTYDVNGNRLTGGASYDEQDRLTNLGGVAYQFNADGFLAQRGTDTFAYTAQGELQDATLPDKEVSYIYDGLGRRVGRILTTGTEEAPVITKEQYLYGNLGNPFQVTAVRDNSGTVSEYYYDQSNCLLAIKQGAAWYYVATDQQGTPRVVSDASGAVIKRVEYDSYGKLISDSNPDFLLPVGYAGGITDPDTKLVHFGLRDYDPEAGRWTARDPVLFNGRQGNLYVYVNNNPVNLRDPYGLFCIGGSAYLGFGGGGQVCVTGEGVSICAEVGFGIGTSVEVNPFGGLARAGNEVGIQGGLTFAGIGPSAGITLDDCGSLKFAGGLSVGPVSQSASYDFLEGTWSIDDLAVGGEVKDLNNKVSDSFKPGFGGNFKAYGKSCMQL